MKNFKNVNKKDAQDPNTILYPGDLFRFIGFTNCYCPKNLEVVTLRSFEGHSTWLLTGWYCVPILYLLILTIYLELSGKIKFTMEDFQVWALQD